MLGFIVLILSLSTLGQSKLLFLSLDGFRWDYIHLYKEVLNNFNTLISEGASVHDGLYNNWVTNTFPSHRSLLTGLYDESHGIMGNKFYAPELNDTFKKYLTDMKFWNWSVPIWKVADDQGVVSACISISGCDVEEQQPTYATKFDSSLDLGELIDDALNRLKEADAVFLYHWQPDRAGHEFGPFSEEMKETLRDIDGTIGYLLYKIKWFEENVDIIVTSDHGMMPVKETMVIDDYFDDTMAKFIINRGSNMHIWPNDQEANLLKTIEAFSKKYPKGFKTVRKSDMDQNLHYANSIRCPPIMLVAEPGYEFVEQKDLDKYDKISGNHGYYPNRSDMHPVFVGRGKSFKVNYNHTKGERVELVDVYPLIAHILNVTPGKHNGSLARISALLDPKLVASEFPKLCSSLAALFVSYFLVAFFI